MAEKRSVPPAARFCAALTTIWLPTPRSAANRYGKRLCRCFAHRTNLCKSDKKSRLDAVSVWMSEFSDSKGQRFESPRPHQRQHPFGRCLFLFCMRFYVVLRGGIRTARARRLTSRRAKKPLRGFFRARLGESPRPQQAAPIWALPFFVLYEILRGAARGDSNSPCPPPYVPAGKKAPAGLF